MGKNTARIALLFIACQKCYCQTMPTVEELYEELHGTKETVIASDHLITDCQLEYDYRLHLKR